MKTPETQQTETMQVEATRAETRAHRQREGGARRASGSQASERVIPPLPANRARRRRRRSNRRALSTFLIIAGIALLLVAAGMWGMAQLRYRKQDQINQKLASYAKVYDETDEGGHRGPEVDWEGLKAVNPDVVGWLQIPGTQVNYPVYQGEDNDHYLRSSAEGEWSVGGQLFLDCDNTAPGMVDPLSLIYGHHLLDGSMFTQVAELDQQEVFDATDTVWYATEQTTYELEPLMVFYAHADDTTVRTFQFENEGKFREYLYRRLDEAVTKRPDADVIVAEAKHVLCLITCNYYEEYESHGRTIVVCVPKDEANVATGDVGV